MKSINNWKRKVIIITVKHSIVKIVTSFECYYLEKCGILFNLVILEGGGEVVLEGLKVEECCRIVLSI